MHGFSRRHTVRAALEWLDAHLQPLAAETIPLRTAAGRVLAAPVISNIDVPGFDRATMDGYAVVADDTEGASSYNRVYLRVVGVAMPGSRFEGTIRRGEAIRIMTGAPLPAGSDAVLPAEVVEADDESDTIAAIASVSPAKNVGRRGEDIVERTVVLPTGRALRPQDLGVVSSIGVAEVTVVRRPRVRLIITGNELLPAGSQPRDFMITDANGPMLAALIERDGGIGDFPGIVRDDADAIRAALGLGPPAASAQAATAAKKSGPSEHEDSNDLVIVSGGSSVGVEDLAPMIVAAHGELAVHGIAMRPSSPTGLGRIGNRLVFLLPGNPVSALCAYDFFAGRAIRALGGRAKEWPYRTVRAALTRKISSQIGRVDYARVRLDEGRVEPLSVSGASVLSSTTRADGFVLIDDDSEGFPAGADVDVWLYEVP
jgi:molybdopterin molybdotransferase